jgi:hypothetical protein
MGSELIIMAITQWRLACAGCMFAVMYIAQPGAQERGAILRWFFRGTPRYSAAVVQPRPDLFVIGIPGVLEGHAVDLITPFVAAAGSGINRTRT